MERRNFLAASIATSAAVLAGRANAKQQPASPREFYQIRRYSLTNGPQLKLTEDFFANALIPALAKRGFGPVGAFRLDIGPETPTYYLVIPGKDLDALARLDLELAEDQQFIQAAAPFWNATAAASAFSWSTPSRKRRISVDRTASTGSTTQTRWPATANTWAMPVPICPAPIMPIRSSAMTYPLLVLISQ